MPTIYKPVPRTILDTIDGGPFSLPAGSTSNTGSPSNIPVRRRVRLHNQATGRLVQEQWSSRVDGGYQFLGLAAGRYYVVAFDHTGQYGGECETDIPAPTPPPAP